MSLIRRKLKNPLTKVFKHSIQPITSNMKRTITCIYASVLIFTFTDSNAQVPDWSSKIAAIVYDNCGSCHRAGSIAPFPLETYVDFTYNATGILESVNNRSMPPWPPDPAYRRLAHERILSANEIQLINDFINGGMPTGDLANAPSFPIFNNNSQVGVPDTVLQTSAYTVSMSTDEYRNFSYPSNFNSEKQFRAIEVIPGNLEVVHHVLMYWDTTGNCAALDAADPNPGYSGFGGVGSNEAQLIGAWVPGSVPTVFPDAFAIQIPANADIVLQFHYAEGTMGEIDSTKINFFYNTSPGLIRPVYFVAALNHVTSMTNGNATVKKLK